MRILHIVNHTWRYNGMVHAAIDLACAQVDLGHTVALVHSQGNFDDLLRERGVQIFVGPTLDDRRRTIATLLALRRAIRTFRPDVVHAHMVAIALIAWPLTKLYRIPLVTCIQNSFSRAAVMMRIGRRVITGCQAVADDMARRGVPRARLRPILNGTIGSARQGPNLLPPVDLKRPAVLTICGLHPRKGVPDLIRGFEAARSSTPNMHLYIVGEGPHELDYRRMIEPEHMNYIHFCGPCLDTRPFLRAADVFVLASLADPAPLVICEAREVGIAIVATRVDGIPELLEHGQAGQLVRPGAPREIAAKLTALLADPRELETWRQNSQIRVERLRVSRVAERTVQVYDECLRNKSA